MTAFRSVASERNSFARSALDSLGPPVRPDLDATSGCKSTAGAPMNYYRENQMVLNRLSLSSRAQARDVTIEARITQTILRDQSPCVKSFTSFRMTAHE